MENGSKTTWAKQVIYTVVFSILAWGLIGCGGGGGGGTSACGTVDTDGDGLLDCEETQTYGTSITLADTDGDGFSDYDEVIRLGFNPDNNNFRFNPLIADLPEIEINLVSAPLMGFIITKTDSSEETINNSTGGELSSTYTSSYSNSTSTTKERGWNLGADGKSLAGGFSSNTTKVKTYTSTKSQSDTNTATWEKGTSTSLGQDVSKSGGYMQLALEVKNTGDIAFTLKNLVLSANRNLSREIDGVIIAPIGNLNLDTPFGQFDSISWGPGESSGTLTFENNDIPFEVIAGALKHSSSLLLDIAAYEVTDPDGVSFAHNMTQVRANSASIVIDYGPAQPPEKYLVAVNIDAASPGTTVAAALNDILRIPYTTGTGTFDKAKDGTNETVFDGLLSLRSKAMDASINGFWMIRHIQDDGVALTETVYNLIEASYDLQAIALNAGDAIEFIYLADADSDGVGEREETMYRTSDTNPDTDGDTLDDGLEIRGQDVTMTLKSGEQTVHVYSDPTLANGDGDDMPDLEEYAANRDPSSLDSDGDHILDEADKKPAVYDEWDISSFTVEAITGELGSYKVQLSWTNPFVADVFNNESSTGVSNYAVMVLRQAVKTTVGFAPEFARLAEVPTNPDDYTSQVDTFLCDDGTECYSVEVFSESSPPRSSFTDSIGDEWAHRYRVWIRINGSWFLSSATDDANAVANYSILRITLDSIYVPRCVDEDSWFGVDLVCEIQARLLINSKIDRNLEIPDGGGYRYIEIESSQVLDTLVTTEIDVPKIDGYCFTVTPEVLEYDPQGWRSTNERLGVHDYCYDAVTNKWNSSHTGHMTLFGFEQYEEPVDIGNNNDSVVVTMSFSVEDVTP